MQNKEKILNNQYIELIFRYILGFIFLYACIHKIADPAGFAKIIYGYKIMPGFTINIIAIILPFVELISALALILGIYPRSGAILINLMLFVFIVAISFNLIRGHEFDCGCFSINDAGHVSDAVELLIRDIIFFFMGIYIIIFKNTRKFCIKQTSGLFNNS